VDLYRSADWKQFRNEVIRLDGGVCSQCGRSPQDGITLHVHHKSYIPGHKPWQYPYDMCYTLCSGCHAAEHGLIPPKFGWEFAGWDDLGSLAGSCECCGTDIRYSFLVSHPNWPSMEVGEVCCDHLTSSEVATNFMESKRRYASRLKRFVSSVRWKEYSGGIHHIDHKRLIIRIGPVDGALGIWLNGTLGKKRFPDYLSARIAIFELLESGALHSYAEKHRKAHLTIRSSRDRFAASARARYD
jgi:hypothetical protein